MCTAFKERSSRSSCPALTKAQGPAKSRFVLVRPMPPRPGPAPRDRSGGPGREPDSNDRHVRSLVQTATLPGLYLCRAASSYRATHAWSRTCFACFVQAAWVRRSRSCCVFTVQRASCGGFGAVSAQVHRPLWPMLSSRCSAGSKGNDEYKPSRFPPPSEPKRRPVGRQPHRSARNLCTPPASSAPRRFPPLRVGYRPRSRADRGSNSRWARLRRGWHTRRPRSRTPAPLRRCVVMFSSSVAAAEHDAEGGQGRRRSRAWRRSAVVMRQ